MNMPGFTAEASLYKTNKDFQIVSGQESLAEQAVVLQGIGGGGNYCYWVQTCTLFLCACRKVCCNNGVCQYTGDWDFWSCY